MRFLLEPARVIWAGAPGTQVCATGDESVPLRGITPREGYTVRGKWTSGGS